MNIKNDYAKHFANFYVCINTYSEKNDARTVR